MGLALFHDNVVCHADLRQQIVKAMLGQLLEVITRDMSTQNNALFIEFNSEVANATTGSRLDLVFKFGLGQRQKRSDRHARQLLQIGVGLGHV